MQGEGIVTTVHAYMKLQKIYIYNTVEPLYNGHHWGTT